MSRTDGTFPNYTKLEISADEWPDSYWDTSRQCQECGFRWPYPHIFNPSPCCEAPTTLVDEVPSIRWPEAVSKLLHTRFNQFYNEYNEGINDENLEWSDVFSNGHYDEEKAAAQVDALLKETQTDP